MANFATSEGFSGISNYPSFSSVSISRHSTTAVSNSATGCPAVVMGKNSETSMTSRWKMPLLHLVMTADGADKPLGM